MIISEVLDAIDNINSITIESEISMCESLLSSYDKMIIIEENYNGNDINGFKIFQEASKMDLVKEDVKNQNKGKSTLNKIIFTIPRLIRSLLRLIMGKLTPSKIKEGKETAEKMTDTAKNMSQEQIKDFNKVFDTKTSSKDRKAAAASLFGKIAVGGVLAVGTTIAATKAVKKIKSNKRVVTPQDIEQSGLTFEELKEMSEHIGENISQYEKPVYDIEETDDEKQKKQPVIDELLKEKRITEKMDELLKLVNENKDKIDLYKNGASDILTTIGKREEAIKNFNKIIEGFDKTIKTLDNVRRGILNKMDSEKKYGIYPGEIKVYDLFDKNNRESIEKFEKDLNDSNNYLRDLKEDLDYYLEKEVVNGTAGYVPGHTYSIKDEDVFKIVEAIGKDIKTYDDLLKVSDQEAKKSGGGGSLILGPSRFVYIEGNGADADVYCDIWPMNHVNNMKYYLDIIKRINNLCKTESVIGDADIKKIENEVKNKSSNGINKRLFSEVYKEYEKAAGELKKIDKELADAHDELQKNLDEYKFDNSRYSLAVGRINVYLNNISEPAKELASMLKVIQDIEKFCFILYSRFNNQSNTNNKLVSTMKQAAEKYEKEHKPKND